jgi:hypothetical protein
LLASLIEVTASTRTHRGRRVLNDQIKKETGKTLKPEVISDEPGRFTWDQSVHLKNPLPAYKVGFTKSSRAGRDLFAEPPQYC